MISLHQGQHGNSVNLSELLQVINSPDQFKAKIEALNESAQAHREAAEAHISAKQEHDAAAAAAEKQMQDAKAALAELQSQQNQLNATLVKINTESKQLEAAKGDHQAAVAAHTQRVEEHGVKAKALSDWEVRAAAKERELKERSDTITAAEAEIFKATTRIRELLPK